MERAAMNTYDERLCNEKHLNENQRIDALANAVKTISSQFWAILIMLVGTLASSVTALALQLIGKTN